MKRSVISESIRFKRTAAIGAAVMIAIAALITVFLFTADGTAGDGGNAGPAGGDLSSVDLSGAAGAVAGLETAASILGIVALSLFGLSIAKDFERGTIRMLVVGQPRRAVLLGGKLIALASGVVLGVLAAAAASIGLGAILASVNGIDTAAWTSADGIAATLSTIGNVALATVVWGLFGAALAMITRSAATSITAGVAYLLIGEQLLTLAWSNASAWLRGGTLSAFTTGGSAVVSYSKSATLLTIYAAAAVAAAFVVFIRRDITD